MKLVRDTKVNQNITGAGLMILMSQGYEFKAISSIEIEVSEEVSSATLFKLLQHGWEVK